LAFASVLVDIFVQLVCLFCFVLPGLGIVLSLVGRQQVSTTAIGLLAIALPAAVGIFSRFELWRLRTAAEVAFGFRRKTAMVRFRSRRRSRRAVATDLA
jgi:hypothetical protein